MVVRGVGVAGGDLYVAKVYAGVEHGGDEGVPEHVRVHPGQLHPRLLGEPAQPLGGNEDDRCGLPTTRSTRWRGQTVPWCLETGRCLSRPPLAT